MTTKPLDDYNVICYAGIQRIFRNAVLTFLRERLKAAFPSDYGDRIARPFRTEWDTVKKHAEMLRATGQLEAPIKDEFDYLGVNNFFNLFDSYYDKLGIDSKGIDASERKQHKQTLLGWLRTIKSMRDPLCHPNDEAFTFVDTDILLRVAQKSLKHLKLDSHAAEIGELVTRAIQIEFNINSDNPPLEAQLPPRESIVVDFVGRNTELDKLRVWISDPESRRWALSGDGGKGKSALAYNFAVEVKKNAPAPFEAVFWLSAKKKKFLDGKIFEIKEPDFHNFDSALTKLLLYYGWVDATSETLKKKEKIVVELLNSFPAFIIVDDVDSIVSADEEVIEFFSISVPATRSKVLFTSRRIIFGLGGTTTEVEGFDIDDAEEFILSRCQLMNLDSTAFKRKTVERIVEATDGSPLYIEDLMRLSTVVSHPTTAIKQWEQRSGDEAREYALGRECELLNDEGKKVLFAACVFPREITFDEIEKLTGLDAEGVQIGLGELQKVFLVSKPSLVEETRRFEINFNTRSLVRAHFSGSAVFRRIEQSYKSIFKSLSEPIKIEIDSVITRASFFVREGKSIDAKDLVDKVLLKYPNNKDLIGFLGFIYKSWKPKRRLTDARDHFLRAARLGVTSEKIYKHWCLMEIEEQEWQKVIAAADKGLSILPRSRKLGYFKGTAMFAIGKESQAHFFQRQAKTEFLKARDVLDDGLKINRGTGPDDDILTLKFYETILTICELVKDKKKKEFYLGRLANENLPYLDDDHSVEKIRKRFEN